MKVAVLILALVSLGCTAPQPRLLFHEHFDEFVNLIIEEVGDEMDSIIEQYSQYDEFVASLNYLSTQNFRDLVYEMEHLSEFIAVVDFLERDNIDINWFIDLIHEAIDSVDNLKLKKMSMRQQISGTDFNSFIRDVNAIFPKDKLTSMYDQKMEEDEVFRVAIENLNSDEWSGLFNALWDNEIFQREVQTLADNGIDVNVLIEHILAIFGQV